MLKVMDKKMQKFYLTSGFNSVTSCSVLCEFKRDGNPDDYYIFYMKDLNKP